MFATGRYDPHYLVRRAAGPSHTVLSAELAPIAFTYISTFAVDAALVQMLPELFDPDFLTPQPVPQLVRLSIRSGACRPHLYGQSRGLPGARHPPTERAPSTLSNILESGHFATDKRDRYALRTPGQACCRRCRAHFLRLHALFYACLLT